MLAASKMSLDDECSSLRSHRNTELSHFSHIVFSPSDELREHLKNAPKMIMTQNQEVESSDSSSTSSSSSSSSDSSSSDSSSESDSDSSDSSSSSGTPDWNLKIYFQKITNWFISLLNAGTLCCYQFILAHSSAAVVGRFNIVPLI